MKYVFLVMAIFSMFILSCKNNSDDAFETVGTKAQGVEGVLEKSDGLASLFLSVGNGEDDIHSRTILPQDVDTGALAYTLEGIKTDGDTATFFQEWETLKAMTGDTSLKVSAGTWNFTLTASKEGIPLYSGKLSRTIKIGRNALRFTMEEVKKIGGETAKGNASVTLHFLSGSTVKSVRVALLSTKDFETEIPGFGYESLLVNANSVVYAKSDIPVGNYVVHMKFYAVDAAGVETEIEPGFMEILQIKSGLESNASRTVVSSDGTEIYHRITYKNIDLDASIGFDAEYAQPIFFNEQQNVTLPCDGEITREGFTLLGWYKTNDLRSAEKIESWQAGGQKGDITIYAKWARDIDWLGEYKGTVGGGITFGSFPQNVKQNDVNIYYESDMNDENKMTRGKETVYLGSDGEWYAKITPRPYDNARKFSDGSTITANANYFKVEAIEWGMSLQTSGGRTLIAKRILDVRPFYEKFEVGANVYKYSKVREYLKNDFWVNAFTKSQQSKIAETSLEYGTDTVFVLSIEEATDNANGFAKAEVADKNRAKVPTDWARANGAYYNTNGFGYWWLRTANDYAFFYVDAIDGSGKATGITIAMTDDTGIVPSVVVVGE